MIETRTDGIELGKAHPVTGDIFGQPVQIVDVPVTSYETTRLATVATPARSLPTAWYSIDPREPLTAELGERVLAAYADWLPDNIRSHGRAPSSQTQREYLREARFLVDWLVQKSLSVLPDWDDSSGTLWQSWPTPDQDHPRPGIPLAHIATPIIEAYFKELMAPGHAVHTGSRNPHATDGAYRPTTMRKKTVGVNKFLEFLHKQGWLLNNPLDETEIVNRLPHEQRNKAQKLKTLLPDEAERLVAECNREIQTASGHTHRQGRAIRNYGIISLMMGQGISTVEIERLSLDNYDQTHSALTVVGKGDRERTIQLRPVPRAVLDLWLKFRNLYHPENDAIFINLRAGEGGPAGKRGQRMGRRRVRQIVDHYLECCGLKRPGVSCHALRHTYATGIVWMSRERGLAVDLVGIAQTMGHPDTKTAEVYVDLVDLHQNNPAQLLDEWFKMPDLGG